MRPDPIEHDIIVVGARCAGAPTAMILARKGYRVLLLERDGVPSNMTHSTHLIHPLGVSYLKDWGLLEAIEARSKPFTDWTVDLHGAVMHGPPPSFAGVAHSIAPRRDILDGELAAAAERRARRLDRRVTAASVYDRWPRNQTESATCTTSMQ